MSLSGFNIRVDRSPSTGHLRSVSTWVWFRTQTQIARGARQFYQTGDSMTLYVEGASQRLAPSKTSAIPNAW
jgi:hypothetical protein